MSAQPAPQADPAQRKLEIERHRIHRLAQLERRCHLLEHERDRLETLLADCLQLAHPQDPMLLLSALCERAGTDPGRAACHQ